MGRMKPEAAAEVMPEWLDEVDAMTAHLLNGLGPAMEWHLGQDDTAAAAMVVARVQDLVRRLRDIESLGARAIGQAAGRLEGELPDGRQFKMHRTADRKAWRHDDWQRDARRAVLDHLALPPELVNPEDGEFVNLYQVMDAIEAVHGAQAPRSTNLRALGLEPGDYCETVRGNWKLDTVAPSTPTTTTDSGEQNG